MASKRTSIRFANWLLLALALLATGCATGRGTRPEDAISLWQGKWSTRLDPAHPALNQTPPEVFRVRFETSEGPFVVEVHRAWAPHGADRFYNLVRSGFFDGQRFFRVRAGYIAQFGLHGDPAVIAAWKGRTIPDDSVRRSNTRGTLAFAMTGPYTRTTQVYVNLADNPHLDAQGFAPFGWVIRGMEVVDRLYADYGEAAGGGIRGGKQGPIEAGGNAYLQRAFPELDYIRRAVLVPEPVRGARGAGAERPSTRGAKPG